MNTIYSAHKVLSTTPLHDHPYSYDEILVKLDSEKRKYWILVGYDCLWEFGAKLRDNGIKEEEAAVFTNPTVGDLYFQQVSDSLKSAGFTKVLRYNIPDGEEHKNWEEFTNCCNFLLENFPESGAIPLVVNLGGGVVGDIGGFAAATFRRGVPYVQIPTTVLGCVDCGIGGKVGVNRGNVKNIMGAFYQPKLVFADLRLLDTLPQRQIRSGVAEVIKYGVVCSGDLFDLLEKDIEKLIALEPTTLRRVVNECYKIKADIVSQDEQDKLGIRNVLNYGHTVGHALEMAAEYRLTHGEAISVGMVAAAKLAVRLGVCEQSVYERSKSLIERAGLPSHCDDSSVSLDLILKSMARDKKFSNGRNLFVLATKIGESTQREGIEQNVINDIINSLLY